MLRPSRLQKTASLSLSVALHAGLVLGLLTLLERESGGDPHIINVTLEGFGTDHLPVRDESASSAAAAREDTDIAETEEPTPGPARPEPAPRLEPVEAAVDAQPEIAAEPARAPAGEVAPSFSPPTVALERVRVDVGRLAPPAPRPAPPPVVTTVDMANAHAELLIEQASSWSRDIDAESLPDASVLETVDGQRFEVAFARETPSDDMGLEHVVATVTTTRDGRTLSAELRLTRLAFSSFAQLVDRWDPSVQIHDDEIDGRFHANSEIYVARSGGVQPTFHGKVTTARGINTSSSSRRVRRSEVFLGGLETRARRILLPGDLALGDGEPVHRFGEATEITFYADGSYGYSPLEGDEPERVRALPDGPVYLVADQKDAELYVSGVVNGQVLVFSPEKVVVVADLVYAVDPFTSPEADDYLGLVSERSVEIAPPDVTGPGDLRIQAAIYAKRRFVVRRYRDRNEATLFIDGSLTSGSLSATEPRFRTRLRFDPRFEHSRPPGFPVTERYELTARDAAWRIEP